LLNAHGFNPDLLGRDFRVGYCADSEVPLARKRVIAPVSQDGELVGWLAAKFTEDRIRFLFAPGMSTAGVVYNLKAASECSTVLVVPSPDWVWRLGQAAVSPISHTDGDRFFRTISSVFRRKNAVVVIPYGADKLHELVSRFQLRFGPQFAKVHLPYLGRNPNPKKLCCLVCKAAARQGLEVTFQEPDSEDTE
jgi:hypothetical protein